MSEKILIVGQGIAGSVLAMQALNAGLDVVVVDDDRDISASKWAGGLVNPVSFKRLTLSWEVNELLPEMQLFYNRVSQVFGENVYTELPFYRVLASVEELNQWDVISEGPKGKFYSELSEKESINGIQSPFGVGQVKHAGWLNVPKFLKLVRDYLISENRFFIESVSESECFSNGNQINFRGINYSRIVVCTGVSIENWPSLNPIQIIPNKGETITLDIPNAEWREIIHFGNFVLPLGSKKFKVGSTYDWNPKNSLPSEEGRKELVASCNKNINLNFEVLEHHAGLRPTTKDRRPALGHTLNKHIYFFGGLGSKGVMLAPFFSKMLLNNFINNEEIDKQVSTQRFFNK
jgi:glycine oxidase